MTAHKITVTESAVIVTGNTYPHDFRAAGLAYTWSTEHNGKVFPLSMESRVRDLLSGRIARAAAARRRRMHASD